MKLIQREYGLRQVICRFVSGSAAGLAIAAMVVCAKWSMAATVGDSDEDLVRVEGRVVDPGGKGVQGARVQTVAWPFKAALSEVRSDKEGLFTITFKKSQFGSTWNSWESTVVAATLQGYAPGWAKWDHVDGDGKLVLKLAADDMPVEGRILDLEGRPVAGVKVTLTNLRPEARDLKSLGISRAPPPEEFGSEAYPSLAGFAAGAPLPAVTGADGRFIMHGLGRDRTAEFVISGGGLATSGFEVLTKVMEKQTRTFQYQPFAATAELYGATFDFTAAPGRVITGTVRDAATGKPMAGVAIKGSVYDLMAVTDAEGRYRLEGVPNRKDVKVTAMPGDDQPYFMCEGESLDGVGMAPLIIDFNLHRGVWITGKVTDKSTGKPIGAARVRYTPYLSNKNFDKLPEFHRSRLEIPGGQSERYTTGADGVYRLVGLPGPAIVTANAIGRPYRTMVDLDQIKCPKGPGRAFLTYEPRTSGEFDHAIREINIPEGVKQTTLDVQCDPGEAIRLVLVDNENKPVDGVVALHQIPGQGYKRLKSSTVDAIAFRPDERRRLFFVQYDRKLGRIVTLGVADAPSKQLKVKLEPISYVTGKLIGQDGQAVAGAALQGFPFELPVVSTEADGSFAMPILPGEPYNLRGYKDGKEFDTDVHGLMLPSGTNKDLGDVHWKTF